MTKGFEKRIGESVSWVSSARGVSIPRTGVVIFHLPAGASARKALKALRPKAPTDVPDVSRGDRYLIEVTIGETQGAPVIRYFVPLASLIDGRWTQAAPPERAPDEEVEAASAPPPATPKPTVRKAARRPPTGKT